MPRIVRKARTSWASLFLDYLLETSENISLVDWDSISKQWVLPAGIVVNLSFWIACLQSTRSNRDAGVAVFRSNKNLNNSDASSIVAWWADLMWLIGVSLFILSIVNTYYCFSRTREYNLNIEQSSNTADKSTTSKTRSFPFTPVKFALGSSGSLGWDILRQAAARTSKAAERKDRDRRVVIAWEPSLISIRFFCVFSPLHVIISYSFSKSHSCLIILLILSLQMLYLVELYIQHGADKKLIYGQVFSEYERNFVEPRLSIMKRDVGVGTRADDNGVYVEVHTPKVGIIDAKKVQPDMPRSASQIKMHDWEKPLVGAGANFPNSPNVWAQSPVKVGVSSRRSIASPAKGNGSPTKLFRPAGWGSSSQAGNATEHGSQPRHSSTIRRSKTTSSLSSQWD